MTDQTQQDRGRGPAVAERTVYRRRVEGDQRVVAASDGIDTLTGYEPTALDGSDRGWLDVVHPDDREALRSATEDAAVGEYRVETYRIRTADGAVRWVRDRFVVADGDRPSIDGVVVDVTRTEERRRELEDDSTLLDAVFENVPIHVFVKDREARHRRLSDHLDFPEDVVGKRDIDVGFIKEASARRAYEDDMRVIEEGETILDQEEHYPAVGEWDLTSKVPLYGDDGEVIGLLGATRRITERKRAQQELRRKTERLEEFADVVARDIRTPLAEARRHAEQIDDPDSEAHGASTPDSASSRRDADSEHVTAAIEAIQRAGAVIDDVLARSRDGETERSE